jgi:signal transduction histidine kinase
VLVLLGWSIWSGASVPAPGGARDEAPWLFGIVALLVVGVCAAVAGHFHARWRGLQQAPAAATTLPAPSPTATDGAALALLMENQPGPAWLFLRATEHDPLRLHARNAAADAWLRSTAPQAAAPQDWNSWLQVLPGPLAQAVRHLAPGQAVQQGAWSLRLLQQLLPGGGSALALVMQPVAGDSSDGSEHESFSYTVSHDLRAPLRVVEGFSRILKEDYGRVLDRIGNDHLDRVLGAAARMNSMIDALLALAQLSTQSLARQPVNLSQLAGFVVDDLKREAPGRAVEVQIEPGLATHGDPTLLRLVLENLLGNAWKYTGRCERAQIAFESVSYDGRQVFVVRDNGAGFDMRFADRLFGVFQRLHSANDFQGTGVGLASVRRIVRRHGGDVWAESEVGQGARFYFTLGQ